MIRDVLRKKLEQIISESTGIRAAEVNPDIPLHEQLSLDSMQFIGLVARVEQECCIELPMAVLEVTTLAEFYAIVDTAVHENAS